MKVRDATFSADPIAENRRLYDLMVRGVPVEIWVHGESVGRVARLVDWEDRDNDWLAVNQFEVVGKTARQPDIVLFLNGLPIVVIELKGTEGKGLPEAFNQIKTYKDQVPELFRANLVSVISDGITARYGSVSADFDRFMRWRTIDGEALVEETSALALETLIHGLLARPVLLALLRRFVVFEDEGRGPVKKIAGCHQFHAVQKALASVLEARADDGRAGVIWHTHGSGKPLLMAYLGGALMHEPALENPTLVVLTDRHTRRAREREYLRGLRRADRRLRHRPGGPGRRHGADLLRGSGREDRDRAGARGADRPGVRRRDRRDRRGCPRRRRATRVQALVGAEKRLDAVAADVLEHFDRRLEAIDGKAMIVCMSRQIAAAFYARIVAARPGWHSDQDDEGAVKVVITGNPTDPKALQPHIRPKARQEVIRNRYRKPDDPLRLVIVCDMWLTGFDAPVMHTLYVDKPMKGHGLMQAIARVNRVFRSKPAGLVVDYIGLAADLKAALAHYSASDRGQTGIDTGEAVRALLTALDVLRTMFHGLDYQAALAGTPADRLRLLPKAIERALELDAPAPGEDPEAAKTASRRRFLDAAAMLAKAFKLAAGTPEADEAKDEVGFFLAVRAAVLKLDAAGPSGRAASAADFAIGQLVNQAVASTEIIDILAACGVDRPDIAVLSEEFLHELQHMEQKNLAVEALRKLLNGEIEARTRTNVVKHEEFSDRLRDAIARYHNRSVDALQVIQELIAMAKSLREQPNSSLSPEEVAFYDALASNESAVEVMGNAQLQVIATELVGTIRSRSTVDWWRRDNIRAAMRRDVRRLLRKYGFPPDLQDGAIRLVIQQAEALAQRMSRAA